MWEFPKVRGFTIQTPNSTALVHPDTHKRDPPFYGNSRVSKCWEIFGQPGAGGHQYQLQAGESTDVGNKPDLRKLFLKICFDVSFLTCSIVQGIPVTKSLLGIFEP